MAEDTLIVRGSRILAEDRIGTGEVWVRSGRITDVFLDARSRPSPPAGVQVLDAGDLVVMPGLVDTHVHVNEPGRTDWEGFETAGMAAAAGGITSIVVMPLNCTPAATNVEALMGEARAAAGKCRVDYGFWGGLVPGNADQLEPMWRAANGGVHGFKAFLTPSGVPDFENVSIDDIMQAEDVLRRLGGPLLVHAEDPTIVDKATVVSGLVDAPRSYAKYLASRPPEAEAKAIAMLAGVSRVCGISVHIVHVAARAALDVLREGFSGVTAETCPHYLTFAAEEIPDGATQFKCAPPIRDRATREALWDALRDETLTMVVSDHSPCPPELKRLDAGDFARAWGGIASLQLGLCATWTGAHARGFGLADIARWMAANPAKLAGIGHRKGTIAAGRDADLILFDPEASWTVEARTLHHRHKVTPYDGLTLRGVVRRTLLRGRTVYDASRPAHEAFPTEPLGRWIKRGPQATDT